METHYLSYNHPNLAKRPKSQLNIGPIANGRFHIVCRVESNPNSGGTFVEDSFAYSKIQAARKQHCNNGDLIVILCDNEKQAWEIFDKFPEEQAPYTVLIDDNGVVLTENT